MTILSWQLGPVFVAADLLVFAVLLAGRPALAAMPNARRRMWITAAVLLAALAAFALSGALHSAVSFRHPGADLAAGWQQWWPTVQGAVGRFGSYLIGLPVVVVYAWIALVIAAWGTALWCGERRERAALILAGVLTVAFPVLFDAFAQRNTGFGLQGRYALPVFALMPVVSGSVIARHFDSAVRLRLPWLELVVVSGWAALQVIAWFVNSHYWHVEAPFNAPALYAPPSGWGPWRIIEIAGAVLVVAGALQRLIAPASCSRASAPWSPSLE